MDTTLTLNDLKALFEDLYEVCDKPKILGTLLNLPERTLNEIFAKNSHPDDCLLDILSTFVEEEEQRPTWRIVLDALRNPLINNPRLAERIEKRLSRVSPTQQRKSNDDHFSSFFRLLSCESDPSVFPVGICGWAVPCRQLYSIRRIYLWLCSFYVSTTA